MHILAPPTHTLSLSLSLTPESGRGTNARTYVFTYNSYLKNVFLTWFLWFARFSLFFLLVYMRKHEEVMRVQKIWRYSLIWYIRTLAQDFYNMQETRMMAHQINSDNDILQAHTVFGIHSRRLPRSLTICDTFHLFSIYKTARHMIWQNERLARYAFARLHSYLHHARNQNQ